MAARNLLWMRMAGPVIFLSLSSLLVIGAAKRAECCGSVAAGAGGGAATLAGWVGSLTPFGDAFARGECGDK